MTQPSPDIAPVPKPVVVPVPVWRWLWSIGLTALMLGLLWHQHLHPAATSFPWGQLLIMLYAMLMWIYAGRRFLLLRRVHKVFGDSIAHMPMPVQPQSYRLLCLTADVLVTGTLVYLGLSSFAWFYGLAAVALRILNHPRILPSHR